MDHSTPTIASRREAWSPTIASRREALVSMNAYQASHRLTTASDGTMKTPVTTLPTPAQNKRMMSELSHQKTSLHHKERHFSKTKKALTREHRDCMNEKMRCKQTILEIRQEIEQERFRLQTVDKYLEQFGAIAEGDVAHAQETCIIQHRKGIGILEKEFGYNPIFRKPGDTFFAYGTVQPPQIRAKK